MRMNPLRALGQHGQSVWLDYIRRHLITSGELQRLIDEDGLTGVTSNPAIFEKAIAGSSDYTASLAAHANGGTCEPKVLYEALAIEDIRLAADVLHPVYERTGGRDGFVSLEVSPDLADDTRGTLHEARRLWKAVGRENVMIKVPATPAGLPAIRQLIRDGINVNVTLLFSVTMYEQVVEAYLSGLEARAAAGEDLTRVASVASFFVSRVDAVIDRLLAEKAAAAPTAADRARFDALAGKVAIANARLVYQRYRTLFHGPRWEALACRGARTQRLLWASTGTKSPAYRDTMYVEELIGAETVNTIPPATFDAFRAHGQPRASLEEGLPDAARVVEAIDHAGISFRQVADGLLADGVRQFRDAFRKLLAAVADRHAALAGGISESLTYHVSSSLATTIDRTLDEWKTQARAWRLWARDPSLWTGGDEAKWLGWLTAVDNQIAHIDQLTALAEDVRRDGFSHALLIGMGGSSLCPDVLRTTFGQTPGCPALHVLDSTDPGQIEDVLSRLDLTKTIVIVSSKSGGTLEPNILLDLVHERVRHVVSAGNVGGRFIAITDPGSSLERVAVERGFRHVAHGVASIGGRYSALSAFGMVPAAIMGLDVARLLDRAARMVHGCASCVPPRDNPGVHLGVVLGVLARGGKDKLTIVTSPGLTAFGAWLEQLVAESTGKNGNGIVPVDLEPVGAPDQYGSDRVFVYVRLTSAPDAAQDAAVARLEQASQPVVRLAVADIYDLGQEFFRWEIATAVAGAIIGINPFDQPDVEASKVATRRLTDEYETSGALPAETPFAATGDLTLYADERNLADLRAAAGPHATVTDYLRAHLARLDAGDYAALLAYVPMTDVHRDLLQQIRGTIRDRRRVATCVGFGPRFLHSTGQVYKGGPNTGVFLQLTCDDAVDLPVPGRRFTFGVVKAAQARGDFAVLAERGRRALRIHLGRDVGAGLAALRQTIEQVL